MAELKEHNIKSSYAAITKNSLFSAFSTQHGKLDKTQMRIIECVNEDNVQLFQKSYQEASKLLKVDVYVKNLQVSDDFACLLFAF